MTCPNRDGTKGLGGCTFCNNLGFTPGYLQGMDDLTRQILAYFQTYSNTYAGLPKLRELYGRVLSHPEIHGIVVGTRPDCLSDDALDYLAALSQQHIVELEIGIESCDEDVLRLCNRG